MFKLIGVILLLYSSVVSAKATTGNDLYEGFREGKKLENHQPANTYKVGMAYGVVIGLVEMDTLQNHTFCISPEVTNGQIFDVVLNYLEKHPESRHKSGAILASFAIWEGFPCPVKKDE